MKFASMLRRLRNTQSGMGSTARSARTPYMPEQPVADAGDNQVVLVGETVSFDGSGSTGNNLSYSWAFGTDATPATGSGEMPSCSYSTIGAKTVTLTVTDNNGATASDTVTITVHNAPIADAGSDQDVSVGKTVSFDGSGSRDPDGGELSYSWAFGTDATPATGTGSMPSCSYSTTGTKTVTLTVTDDEGVSRSDTATITVHSLPVADAGSSQGTSVGETVNFDGSDSEGSNLSYSWDFGADATPATDTGAMPSCSYSTPGDKVVRLTVTDAAGATASDTVIIYIFAWPAPPPDAEAGEPQTVLVGETVNFDGSRSTGNNLKFSWDFGTDATPATGRRVTSSCTYSTTGEKTVTLTITDITTSARPTDSDTVTITVHNAPIANAGSDQTVLVGETVSFDGSGSSDPDGGNLTYSWDFGTDATPATGSVEMPSCTYSTIGTKTVTLTVTDDEGATASDTVTITVHKAPIADAGSDQRVAVGSEVSFDGRGSNDPDGGNLTYSWDFGADADPETAEGVMPFCIYSARGAKTVILTVTDDEGATASDTVTINVYNPPVADAGNNQTVAVGTEVSFDGSGSSDPDGGVLTYSWEFGDAEDPTAIGSEVTASHTYSTIGDKTVTLTVTDDEGAMASHTVIITVFKVDAGDAQRVFVGKRVNFTGTIENAPAGVTYSWDFGHDATDAEDDDGLTPSCTYTMGGSKTVELTVSYTVGGEVVEASDTVTITVIEVGVALSGMPRVVAVGGSGTRVSFEGTVSNAPADATFTYSWNFGDGAIHLRRYGSTASCIYTLPGVKPVKLTVGVTIDGQEVQVEGTCVIEVFKVDAGSPQIVAVGETVDFTGTVSNAPENATLTYSWDFGAGATNVEDDDGLTPSCSYTTAGDKTVRLTVSFTLDGELIEGSGDVKITVLKSRLRVQGARGLSPLEKAAVKLVFGNSIEPDALSQGMTVQVDEEIIIGGSSVGGSYGAGIIKISRVKHQFAEELDGDTTVDDIDLTIPNNIKYLATLIHEVGHHWQSIKGRYNAVRIPKYEFNNEVLESLDFVCKEEHAAVGQVYFILKWQLHHGHDPINITQSGSAYKNVGPVNRYASIADIPPINGDRYIDPPEAIQLVNNFGRYLEDLRR